MASQAEELLKTFNSGPWKEATDALARNDGEKAIEIYKKLDALGSGFATYNIGDIYFHAQGGVKRDINKAKTWYEKALTCSIPTVSEYAAYKLGIIYESGYGDDGRPGPDKDYGKAFSYYKRLENSKIARGSAVLRLGVMYEKGHGTEKDIEKALELYTKSYKLGHLLGKKCLGSLKVRTGSPLSGYFLWITAVIQVLFLALFNAHHSRTAQI